MAILKFAVIAVALTLLACQREPTLIEVPEHQVVVQSLLIGGDDSVRVLVARASTTNSYDLPNGVTNAEVRLIGPNQTIALTRGSTCVAHHGPESEAAITNSGCYTAAVPGGIVHGAAYQLEIVVPGLPTIHGSTQVPVPPTIQSPAPNTEVRYADERSNATPFPVAWTATVDARVAIHLQTSHTTCRAGFRHPEFLGIELWIYARGSGSLSAQAGLAACIPTPDRIDGHLFVIAFDDNYDRWATRFDDSVREAEASVGLTGAFGLFGSAAQSAVPVVLVKQ